MKRVARYFVMTLLFSLVFVSVAAAGELEDELMKAAITGDLEAGRMLIKKGADVNFRNSDGGTPLSWAIMPGQAEFARLLVENGADINARSKEGLTPLMAALVAGGPGGTDIALLLIEKGADVNAVESGSGGTALLVAAGMGNVDVVKALIARGADVNAKTDRGLTPLGKALDQEFDPGDKERKARNDEIIRLLKAAGAK